jgi:protoporphyrinogen oxidase
MSKKLIIAGGGITGLSIAYIASKSDYDITVLEASDNMGGLLNTFEIENTQLEYFYHHFFTHDAEINWLIKDLGIEDKLVFKKTNMGVYRDGEIFDFNTPLDLLHFKPINLIDKLKFGFSSLYLSHLADWQDYENISALSWLEKHAGKTTTEALWKPMLDVKFGPYANQVPLAWLIGRLKQRLSSRKKGEELLGYLKGGLQTLLDELLKKLKESDVTLKVNSPVNDLKIKNNNLEKVLTPKGNYQGEKVILTFPTTHIKNLFQNRHPKLYRALDSHQYFGAICTILKLKKPLSNIYWLNVAEEEFPFGGVIEHTNFISPKVYNGKNIVYLSRYFALDEPIADLNEEEIKKIMTDKLNKIYPNFHSDDIEDIYVFKSNTAAPVIHLNYSETVLPCNLPINNLYLANMMHIYPDERSVNNSIRVASEACRVMGIPSNFVPKGNSLAGKIGFEK